MAIGPGFTLKMHRMAGMSSDSASCTLHNVSYATLMMERAERRGDSRLASRTLLLAFWALAWIFASPSESVASGAPPARSGGPSLSGTGTDPSLDWGYLQNGAGYVVIENHAAPMIGSVAIVHAGSGAEDWSTQGASHFLEHLLFNGTTRRTQEHTSAHTHPRSCGRAARTRRPPS